MQKNQKFLNDKIFYINIANESNNKTEESQKFKYV